MYTSMASRISSNIMYSSAVCERDESPGPIFTEGNGMRAGSERVGEPNGLYPARSALRTNGCCMEIADELSRKERGAIFTSGKRDLRISTASALV